jgi:hypothetical protein
MGASHLNFLNDINSEARANLASIDFDGVGFWMYHSGFQSMLAPCTRLRNVKIYMHIGHLVSADTYYDMRHYVIKMKEDWEKNVSKIELCGIINMFAGLPALQNLHLVCAITAWNARRFFSSILHETMEDRQKKMLGAVELGVSEKLREVLEGKDVDVTVASVGAAARLRYEPEEA